MVGTAVLGEDQARLGGGPVQPQGIVPAAVNERDVAEDLLDMGPPPRDLLMDKGFSGAAFAARQAARSTAVLIPPAKGQRQATAPILRKIIAEWRNRIETTFGEITDLMELARHGAHTFWGFLTRAAATSTFRPERPPPGAVPAGRAVERRMRQGIHRSRGCGAS